MAKAAERFASDASPDNRRSVPSLDNNSPSVIRSDARDQGNSENLSAESIAHLMNRHDQPPVLASVVSPSPGKSSLTSRRLRGPRLSDPSTTSQIYGSTTYSSSSISRRAAGMGSGPYQPKTVTFRDVADVKEFETESSGGEEWEDEGDFEEGESWDEVLLGPPGTNQERASADDSIEYPQESFMENTPSPEMDLSGLKRYGSLNSRPSPARSPLQRERGAAYAEQEREEEQGYAGYIAGLEGRHAQMDEDESTTANFIDSLYEDGYLSPPQSQSVSASGTFDRLGSVLEDEGEMNDGLDDRLRSVQNTSRHQAERTHRQEMDEGGIPLGRTHHADRAAAAHEAQRYHQGPSLHQPALPRVPLDDEAPFGETMLRNGDARTPATALARDVQHNETVTAHQDGQFVDPFVTIQTATRVNASDYHGVSGLPQQTASTQNRQEDGVPLGRTSHAERAKVARLMATRGLGLGMPARPMVPFVLGGIRSMRQRDRESEDGSIGSDGEYDDRGYSIPELSKLVAKPDEAYDQEREAQQSTRSQYVQPSDPVSLAPLVSPFPQQMDSEINPVDQSGSINGKRALPKPPKPTPVIGMPSPVEKSENQREIRAEVPEERVTSPVSQVAFSTKYNSSSYHWCMDRPRCLDCRFPFPCQL